MNDIQNLIDTLYNTANLTDDQLLLLLDKIEKPEDPSISL